MALSTDPFLKVRNCVTFVLGVRGGTAGFPELARSGRNPSTLKQIIKPDTVNGCFIIGFNDIGIGGAV